MINEAKIDVEGGYIFCRYSEMDETRDTILFLHGLGESGLSFLESLEAPELYRFNKLVPDLPGYGKSSRDDGADYSFSAQIRRIDHLLEYFGISSFHVIGHSMGGDIGTLFCARDPGRVRSFINIEGDLTPDDRFMTTKAIEADKKNCFYEWFLNDFREGIVMEWSKKWPSCIRYAKSLSMCSPKVFLTNVYEIYQLNEAISNGCCGRIGLTYKQLRTPKVYCWGTESLSAGSRNFLVFGALENHSFARAFHWVMLDRREAFYSFAAGFLSGCIASRKLMENEEAA